jgi:hypothetical protein
MRKETITGEHVQYRSAAAWSIGHLKQQTTFWGKNIIIGYSKQDILKEIWSWFATTLRPFRRARARNALLGYYMEFWKP